MSQENKTQILTGARFAKETRQMVEDGRKAIRSVFKELGSNPGKVNILMDCLKPAYALPSTSGYSSVSYGGIVGNSEYGGQTIWNFDVLFAGKTGDRQPVKVTMFYNFENVYEQTVTHSLMPQIFSQSKTTSF